MSILREWPFQILLAGLFVSAAYTVHAFDKALDPELNYNYYYEKALIHNEQLNDCRNYCNQPVIAVPKKNGDLKEIRAILNNYVEKLHTCRSVCVAKPNVESAGPANNSY